MVVSLGMKTPSDNSTSVVVRRRIGAVIGQYLKIEKCMVDLTDCDRLQSLTFFDCAVHEHQLVQ